jgi:soluble lytic murein transglycosylase
LITLLPLLLAILTPTNATPWVPDSAAELRGGLLVRAAASAEQLGPQASRYATSLYFSASRQLPALADLLALEAARHALIAKDRDLLLQIKSTGALDRPTLSRAQVQLEAQATLAADGLPDPATTRRALDGPERAEICAWLVPLAAPADAPKTWSAWKKTLTPALATRRAALLAGVHARCEGEGAAWGSPAQRLGSPLKDEDRLERADLLFSFVHFTWTLQELDRIRFDALDADTWCQATFRRARATYRLRKLRPGAQALYASVIERCTTPGQDSVRLPSRYASGKWDYEQGRRAEAAAHFKALLEEPRPSRYADDALYYMAKIARAEGDRAAEVAALDRALKEARDGDMIHELAWEVLEADLRAGRYKAFLTALARLDLPRDDEYFSQGRLAYFAALSHERLGSHDAALDGWRAVWAEYPLSFYGYLSWCALTNSGVTPTPLPRPTGPLDDSWLFPAEWRTSPAALLGSIGAFDLAARAEQSAQARADSLTELDRWRLAYLFHRAGNYPKSHNIPRRQIPGIPWLEPEAGRALRWLVAWPDPFGDIVAAAHKAEQAQTPKLKLDPAFPRAIMREESSFIPTIESYAGALGLMQLMPATAAGHDDDLDEPVTDASLRTPEVNVRVGIDHIFHLSDRFSGHAVLMAAAYNAGGGAVRSWLRKTPDLHVAFFVEDIPALQTRDYTKRVIGSYLAYQWLLGADTFDAQVGEDVTRP